MPFRRDCWYTGRLTPAQLPWNVPAKLGPPRSAARGRDARGLVTIEDSRPGVAAAVAAGLACVAVRTSLTSDHDHGAAALTIGSLTTLDLPTLDRIAADGRS